MNVVIQTSINRDELARAIAELPISQQIALIEQIDEENAELDFSAALIRLARNNGVKYLDGVRVHVDKARPRGRMFAWPTACKQGD